MDNTMLPDASVPPARAGAEDPARRAGIDPHEVVDRMARAADDASRRVKPAVERAAHMAHEAIDKVADVARPGAEWARERGDRLDEMRGRMVEEATGYVTAKPWTCLAIAAVTGFLAGRLLR